MRCFQSPMAVDADLALQPCCPHTPRARNWHSGGPCRFWQLGWGEWLQHALLLTTLLPSYPPHHPFPRAGQDSDPEEALHAQAHLHLSVLPLDFFLYCSWTRAGSGRSASCAARVCLSFFCPQRLQRALRLDPAHPHSLPLTAKSRGGRRPTPRRSP